jgi:NAD(P)-dependent dehydrogenase (short-subunit alcohol dehydrogenase family)
MKRVCLVTGANGTLGSAVCSSFARDFYIVAAYRSEAPLEPSQDSELFDPLVPRAAVAENDGRVFAVRADLASDGEIDRLVELALARYDRIDLIVNAAADMSGCPLTDPRNADAWLGQLWLNAVVPVQVAARVAHAFWRSDEAGNRRHARNVVNVSSTAGLGGAPGTNRGFYGASKAALNVLTRQMAVEYRPLGVRVNAVVPTFFPEVVATNEVVDAIRRFDEGHLSGRLMILDGKVQRWA